MAIELKFHKTDNSPWGFRLTGGADCDVPLTVIKVVEESIADINGLRVGDVIVRINDDSVADCTHEEVHQLISEAGQQLVFGVRRDYYTNEDDKDENNNLEVTHIMNSTVEESTHQLEISEKYEQTKNTSTMSSITDDQIAEAISGQAEVLPDQNILGVNFNKIDLSQSTILNVLEQQKLEESVELKERKWSAFLQKPERPIMKPKPKSTETKAPPYQVVIKKQKRKNLAIDAQCLSEPEPTEEENEPCTDFDENQEISKIDDANNSETYDNEQSINENEDAEESENEVVDSDRESINQEDSENELSESKETKEEVEVQLSVDEQLAQVQMQLRALAQLPSSIQDNLESVTQQLTKILFATQLRYEEENNLNSAHVSRGGSFERSFDETLNTKENTENLDEEIDVAENEEEYNSNASETSETFYHSENETPLEEILHQEFENEDTFEPEINEEELERLRIEADKTIQKERNVNVLEESYQRRLEQRPTYPLAPVQRPIILPGGRKWAQPGDALPVRKKKSSLSDEKIIETLDTYSETIVGHTKGINFLKFQPPAKNLDYLQKSEVYKLIHDMDPPPRGIATRPEIVPSEQDYYT